MKINEQCVGNGKQKIQARCNGQTDLGLAKLKKYNKIISERRHYLKVKRIVYQNHVRSPIPYEREMGCTK